MQKQLLLFIFAVFFICINTILAQQQVFVSGIIRDSASQKAIANVNIRLLGSTRGTETNENGYFEFYLDKRITQILEISHIAYETQTATFSKELLAKKDTIQLNLNLDSKVIEFKGISITSERAKLLQREMLDFEINDSLVFVLANHEGKPALSVYTLYDYLVYKRLAPPDCNMIYYDLSDYLSIRNSAYFNYFRFFYNADKSYIQEMVFDTIEEQITDFVYKKSPYLHNFTPLFSTENYMFFSAIGWSKEDINLIAINKRYQYPNYIHSAYDKYEYLANKDILIQTNNPFIDRLQAPFLYPFYKLKNPKLINFLYVVHNVNVNAQARDTIYMALVDEIEANALMEKLMEELGEYRGPIKIKRSNFVYYAKTDSGIYIFNFDKKIIHQLGTNLRPKYEAPIANEFSTAYCSGVIFNQEKTSCYVKYEKNSKVTLTEIDLQTGKSGETIELVYPFAEKIRIVNNYVYYIYKDFASKQRYKKYLYKQRIE